MDNYVDGRVGYGGNNESRDCEVFSRDETSEPCWLSNKEAIISQQSNRFSVSKKMGSMESMHTPVNVSADPKRRTKRYVHGPRDPFLTSSSNNRRFDLLIVQVDMQTLTFFSFFTR